jgi:ribosomal protein S18 acetylase RimI-like enzyme
MLRPFTDADMPFLRELYTTIRADELLLVPWDEEQKAAFVSQQFEAQHAFWQENYQQTAFDIVELDGRPIGRLYVARWPAEIRIVDIALLPEFRGSGIGSKLLADLFEEADQSQLKISIHVEIFNRARTLYERLGFTMAGDRGVYILMERAPRQQMEVSAAQ